MANPHPGDRDGQPRVPPHLDVDGPRDGVDVIVLAGGRSRRLGTDKAVVVVGGRRQVDRVVAAVRPLGGRVLLAAGPTPPEVAGTVTVDDDPHTVGPLAGIVAGLEAATTEFVAIVAVDVITPSPDLLESLAREAAHTGSPGVVPIVGGRWQHLHAVVRRDLVRCLASAPGASVRAAMAACGVVGIEEVTWRTWAPGARPDGDIDTREDLLRARGEVADEPRPEPSG